MAELNKIVSEVDCTKDIEEFILSTGQKEEFYPTLSVYVTPEQSEVSSLRSYVLNPYVQGMTAALYAMVFYLLTPP